MDLPIEIMRITLATNEKIRNRKSEVYTYEKIMMITNLFFKLKEKMAENEALFGNMNISADDESTSSSTGQRKTRKSRERYQLAVKLEKANCAKEHLNQIVLHGGNRILINWQISRLFGDDFVNFFRTLRHQNFERSIPRRALFEGNLIFDSDEEDETTGAKIQEISDTV